jgi:lysozyme family protein
MKKYILTAIFVCLCFITDNTQASLPEKGINYIKKADFRTAYAYILKHEGWYANVPGDRGKETYGGISRKYNPNWWGWRFIDEYKRNNGPITRYTHFPELDFWVMDYYLDIWVKEEFYNLHHQNIANYVLDFRINGTIGAKLVNKSLRELGMHTTKENVIDSTTINALNNINRRLFLNHLKNRRIHFYKSIAKRDTTQEQFLNHWIKRSKSISYE